MRVAALVAGILLAATPVAHADTSYKPKSRDTAKLLSGAGAGVSSALVLAGFLAVDPHDAYNAPLLYAGLATSVVTPSFGEWYAGQWLTYGMAIRGGAVILAGIGLSLTEQDRCDTIEVDNSCTTIQGKGVALLGIAAIAYVGGMMYDVLDAPDAVDRYEARHHIMITPGPMTPMTGPPGAGLWIRGTF